MHVFYCAVVSSCAMQKALREALALNSVDNDVEVLPLNSRMSVSLSFF